LDTMSIIQRIHVVLAEKGISKSAFYDGAGLTSGGFSMWKTGRATPSKRSLERIADFLGVTLEWLETGTGQKEKPTTVLGDGLNDSQRAVLRLFDSLDDQEKRALLAMARGLISSRQSPGDL